MKTKNEKRKTKNFLNLKNTFFLITILNGNFVFSQTNVIPTNGNVGIGTTTPETQLDVKGNVKVDSTLTVGDSAVFESATLVKETFTVEGVSRLQEDAILTKDLTVDGKAVFNGGIIGNNNFKLTSISTPLPNNLPNYSLLGIDLEGNVQKITIPISANAFFNEHFAVQFCEQNGLGNDLHPYWEYGINKLYVACNNTNVGIGTSDPSHKLTLAGNQLTYGSSEINQGLGIGTQPSNFAPLNIKLNSANGAGIQIKGNSAGTFTRLFYGEIYDNNAEVIKIHNATTNTIPFILYGDGKMVINNGTQKTLQLDQDGLLRARKVKVDVVAWPDYVFESNYNLRPLSEVKNFIQTEKHLPGVPSATQLENEGVDLVETNKMLMEKIEELTLYLIQQEERINLLESKLK